MLCNQSISHCFQLKTWWQGRWDKWLHTGWRSRLIFWGMFREVWQISQNIRQNIGLDLQPVCSHLSHRPCHRVLGCKQYQAIRAPTIFKFHASQVIRYRTGANITCSWIIAIFCVIKISVIVFRPRLDGRDDETHDYTLVEDQHGYFGDCFEKYGKYLETFAKISTLIFSMCVVICLIVLAITSWAENNIKQLLLLHFIFVNFNLRDRILLISNFRGVDELSWRASLMSLADKHPVMFTCFFANNNDNQIKEAIKSDAILIRKIISKLIFHEI